MSSLEEIVAVGLVRESVPLKPFNTYRLGGPARWLAEIRTASELERVASAVAEASLPVLILGRGSNLVISDEGFPGLALHLTGEFSRIEMKPTAVVAGASVQLPQLARLATNAGRLGLEFFVGIPGSVGGAVRQNAGCHGSETVEWLESATVLDLVTGESSVRTGVDLELSYRHSNLRPSDLVTEAGFRFEAGDPRVGAAAIREITRWRKLNQPGGRLNAGSVFKNPPGDHAGRLIDSLGLKGFRVGGASVSEKHANFFVASTEATAADVFRLVQAVRRRVLEETGIALEPELVFAGRFEESA